MRGDAYAWTVARLLAEDRKRAEREARVEAEMGASLAWARHLNDALTVIEEAGDDDAA